MFEVTVMTIQALPVHSFDYCSGYLNEQYLFYRLQFEALQQRQKHRIRSILVLNPYFYFRPLFLPFPLSPPLAFPCPIPLKNFFISFGSLALTPPFASFVHI